eukprot:4373047-Prymnesium_polylepis.1
MSARESVRICICGCPIWDLHSVPAPGMTLSSGADFSAPGISPCPLRGSRPTRDARPAQGLPPVGHSPASHVGDAPG